MVMALLVATLPGCGGGGSDSNRDEPQDPPPAATRAFDMGFTTWPYDATVAAVNFVYTETSGRGDFIAHHLDGGVPWQAALDGAAYHPAVEAEIQGRRTTPRQSSACISPSAPSTVAATASPATGAPGRTNRCRRRGTRATSTAPKSLRLTRTLPVT